jgi:bacillithiol system protein YtxJ
MNWKPLTDVRQLDEIDSMSADKKIMIFKHSTRCSISSMAHNRLENKWRDDDDQKAIPYYLDLLNHRDISNAIASRYDIIHESPQILIISKGKCVYTASHSDIIYDEIISELGKTV